jgi:hypothetical protein
MLGKLRKRYFILTRAAFLVNLGGPSHEGKGFWR